MVERHSPDPAATLGHATTVRASQGGLYATTSTAAAEMDLTGWVINSTGRYVKITAVDADLYFLWAADTGATIDETATSSLATAPGATIPDIVFAGTSVQQVIHPGYRFLRFKTKSGSGGVRVFRS